MSTFRVKSDIRNPKPETNSKHENPNESIRSRGDAQAHRQGASAAQHPIEHPLVPRHQPRLHTDQAAVEQWVRDLRKAGEFAYDSEFIGEQTFYAKFCLLQSATAADIDLVDALAEVDLTAFWELLADPTVRKIVHAGRQDFEPVVRFVNQPPRNVFDVQIAAGFIGLDYPPSLDRLLEAVAGIDLDHDAKLSQWDRRPLSPMQRRYAADDVRYLPLVVDKMLRRLDELGNRRWCEAEMANLEHRGRYRFDPLTQKLQIKNLTELDGRQWGVLQALIRWRAEQAEHDNIPPRTLVADEALASLARSGARTWSDLGKVRFLPRPVTEHFGQPLLEVIQASHNQPPADPPYRPPPLMRTQKARLNRLWAAVKQRAEDHQIDPGVVLAKRDLTRYVRQTTDRDTPPEHCPLLEGWRGELLHDVLVGE